jgi:hypothetical protein
MHLFRALILAISLPLALAGCQEGGAPQPYLKITGGSFIFNYRLATAYAGVLIIAERDLPEGAIVAVTFENPAGGPPFELSEKAAPGDSEFNFTIEPLSGIKAGVDYVAVVRLLGADGSEIERLERIYRSQIDQETQMPEKPLTIGPGYTPNPEAAP